MEKKFNENMENVKENMEKNMENMKENMENVKENLKEKKVQFQEKAKAKKFNPKSVYFWLSFIFSIFGLIAASVHYLPEEEKRDEYFFYGILGLVAEVVLALICFLISFIIFMMNW